MGYNISTTTFKKIFALNSLRVRQAHVSSNGYEQKIVETIAVFGIDIKTTTSGWGNAIDALYDGLIQDINSLTESYLNQIAY